MQNALLSTLNEYKTRYANIIHHHRRRKEADGAPLARQEEQVGDKDGTCGGMAPLDIEPPLPPVVLTDYTGGEALAQFKLSVYGDVVLVEEYDYWVLKAMSRWWYSQSRANMYNYFDREFWSLLKFFEECCRVHHAAVPDEGDDPHLMRECVDFMEELMPALVNLKTVYPDYDGFNELLQDIVETVVVYHETMEFELKAATSRHLLLAVR